MKTRSHFGLNRSQPSDHRSLIEEGARIKDTNRALFLRPAKDVFLEGPEGGYTVLQVDLNIAPPPVPRIQCPRDLRITMQDSTPTITR